MVLDLVEFQHLPYIIVDKGYTIITDNPIGYSEPDNYVLLNEVCYCSSRNFMERHYLYPFGEIIRSHQDSFVSTRWWIYWSHQIKPPSVERP